MVAVDIVQHCPREVRSMSAADPAGSHADPEVDDGVVGLDAGHPSRKADAVETDQLAVDVRDDRPIPGLIQVIAVVVDGPRTRVTPTGDCLHVVLRHGTDDELGRSHRHRVRSSVTSNSETDAETIVSA